MTVCRHCLRPTEQRIGGVPYCSARCLQNRWDWWTAVAKETTAYWRHHAEQHDRLAWCEDCEKSYFAHFDGCPHCQGNAEQRGVTA